MRKSLKALLVAAGVAAGLFGAQTLMAHEGSGGMMGMMGQMGQMMDGCSKMMQDHQNGDSQKPTQTPTEKIEKQGFGGATGLMGLTSVMPRASQMIGAWR
jgi:hypothetical protein